MEAQEQILALQEQLKECQAIQQSHEEVIEALRAEISELRSETFQSQASAADAYDNILFTYLEKQNASLIRENMQLREKFLRAATQRNELKQERAKLRALQTSSTTHDESKLAAENKGLTANLDKLRIELDFQRGQTQEFETQCEQLRQDLDECHQTIEEMKVEGKKKFGILHDKLVEEREKKEETEVGQLQRELADLQAAKSSEAEQYESEIRALKASFEQLTSAKQSLESQIRDLEQANEQLEQRADENSGVQMNFIQTLERLLGCSDLPTALHKVQELVQLPKTIENLQNQLGFRSAVFRPEMSTDQKYTDLIEALTQILQNMSPNALKLPPDSELRQLFAALYNMIHAALDPAASKSVLVPHIRALVFQARSFSPAGEK